MKFEQIYSSSIWLIISKNISNASVICWLLQPKCLNLSMVLIWVWLGFSYCNSVLTSSLFWRKSVDLSWQWLIVPIRNRQFPRFEKCSYWVIWEGYGHYTPLFPAFSYFFFGHSFHLRKILLFPTFRACQVRSDRCILTGSSTTHEMW